MHYRVGRCRCLMFAILLASVLHVGIAKPADIRPELESANGAAAAAAGSPSDLLNAMHRSMDETANIAEKFVWGAGKFLLGAGESVSYAMDVALGSAMSLLKAGGRAYDALATRVGHVPVVGLGAAGVNEAVKTALEAMDSNRQHETEVRKHAFDTLKQKLTASGARLQHSSGADPTRGDQYHTTTVVFPQA